MIERGMCQLDGSDVDFYCEYFTSDDSSDIILKIIGSTAQIFKFDGFYETILCKFGSEKITFYNCESISYNNVYAEYKVEGFLKYIHLKKLADLKIISYAVSLPTYVLSAFETNFEIEPENDFIKEETHKITEDLAIKLIGHKNVSSYGYTHITKYFKLLKLEYKTSQPLNVIYEDLIIIKEFLEFNLGESVIFHPHHLIYEKTENIQENLFLSNSLIENTFSIPIHSNIFKKNILLNFDVEKETVPAKIFFKPDSFNKVEIFEILKTWYNNRNYRGVYQYYLDSNDWLQGTTRSITNVMFNNRFLNMIQALESSHKIEKGDETTNENFDNNFSKNLNKLNKILKSDETDLLEWTKSKLNTSKSKRKYHLKERLQELINSNKKFLGDTYIKSFPKSAKDLRDKLSHGDIDKGVFQGYEIETYYNFAKLLLTIIIFKTLRIDDDKINDILSSNYNIIKLKRSIKNGTIH